MMTRCFLLAGLIVMTVTLPSLAEVSTVHDSIPHDINRVLGGYIQQGNALPGNAGQTNSLQGSGPQGYDPQEDFYQGQMRAYVLQKQQEKQQTYQTLLLRAYRADEDTLRAALKSKSSAERFAATYIVGERLLPWQDELIDQLTDPSDAVRQAARRSLVMLSFFPIRAERMATADNSSSGDKGAAKSAVVDFGPKSQANKPAQEEAANKWRAWWNEHGGIEKAKRSEIRSVRSGAIPEREAALLSAELVYADSAQQAERLTRYRNEKGSVYTDAIVDALPSLNGEILQTARLSLAERLSRMTAATLRDRLGDLRPELRRAAALGWAMKEDRDAIPELIPMLADPDDFVVRGVNAALKSLTGQDFGPARNATPTERTAAVAAWKSWWKKQQ
jgi:hypothetical protein